MSGAWQPTGYVATDFAIEPDASAATYLWAAQALTGGSIDLGTAHRRASPSPMRGPTS